MKTYNIKYEIHLNDGSVIRDKEIKVKRCTISIEAQCKLEKYLKKKNDKFKKLVVHSCKEDIMSMFDDIFPGTGIPTAGGFPFGNMAN
jgi:hypothetical protein